MKNYLKEYHITLKTIGPVFVGSGKKLSKKEINFDDLIDKGIVEYLDVEEEETSMIAMKTKD